MRLTLTFTNILTFNAITLPFFTFKPTATQLLCTDNVDIIFQHFVIVSIENVTQQKKIASAESRTISKRRATQLNDRMEWTNAVGKNNENENRIADVSVHWATGRMALIAVINKNYVHESWGTKTEKRQRMENIKNVFLLFLYARHTVLNCIVMHFLSAFSTIVVYPILLFSSHSYSKLSTATMSGFLFVILFFLLALASQFIIDFKR